MSYTVVSFHAHPDDEALLTAGTLARAAADGHRVILVVATDGAAGLASSSVLSTGTPLATLRRGELSAAAAALGVSEVIDLGYGDSGYDGNHVGERPAFATSQPEQAAARLAGILREVGADVLTSYDSAGGYGHPDHRQVHAVASRAAALAETPVVLEATVDRALLQRALRAIRWAPGLPAGFRADVSEHYCARAELTHRVDVRRFSAAKRAAMAAHASQTSADGAARTLAFCLRLPQPLYTRVFGYEWFREVGRVPGDPLLDDIFATLRAG
jgi:LmbE family N-acetylglucosaminyl deacetylase